MAPPEASKHTLHIAWQSSGVSPSDPSSGKAQGASTSLVGTAGPQISEKGGITIKPHLVSVLLGGLEVLGLMGSIHSSLNSSSLFWPGFSEDLQEKSEYQYQKECKEYSFLLSRRPRERQEELSKCKVMIGSCVLLVPVVFLSARAGRGGIWLLIIVLGTSKEQQQHKGSARKDQNLLLDLQGRQEQFYWNFRKRRTLQ